MIASSNDNNPIDMVHNHRVIAYSFSERDLLDNEWIHGKRHSGIKRIDIAIYDPNYPNDDGVTIYFYTGCDDSWIGLTHNKGVKFHGFFKDDYVHAQEYTEKSVATDFRVFDGNLYLQIYDDLTAAFNGNISAAIEHWINCGINEGRRASQVFDPPYYLTAHLDLINAFGADNYSAAITHWHQFGINEGRRTSLEFDVSWYLENHGDLVAAFGHKNYAAAIQHWYDYGLNEGRQSSPDFNIKAYLSKYPDLVSAFGPTNYRSAFTHWLHYGKNEGRSPKQTVALVWCLPSL